MRACLRAEEERKHLSLSRAHISFAALLGALAVWMLAAPTARAAFGVSVFEAGTCVTSSCTYASVEHDHGEAFTQAAGHPPWGITTFELNHKSGLLGEEPEGSLKRVRVDVPEGLAADPQALPACPRADFEAGSCPSSSKVGTTEMVVYALAANLTISGNVYNLPPEPGLPLLFGIEVAPLKPLVTPVRMFLEGHVAWSSDYHEYFEINNIPTETEVSGGVKAPLAVLKSKLNFNGRAGEGNFLTLPSVCSSTTESHLEVESWSHQVARATTHTPIGVEGCQNVPFAPSASVSAANPTYDEPDAATIAVRAPQKVAPGDINTADIKDVSVALPEGLTLNPAAARGLSTCSPAQIGIGRASPVSCPAASKIGAVLIETDLPAGSLGGPVYLGNPGGGAITGPPFTIYLDAESSYDVSVRLAGLVNANPSTGRLEASFTENPQLPFSELLVTLKSGPQAPLANPLSCATAQLQSAFTPYSGLAAAFSSTPFASAGCPNPLPFAWSQASSGSPHDAGAFGKTSYSFRLARSDGEQYLSHVSVKLPAGLVGEIPAVPQCKEPQAARGSCPSASEIGRATVSVGAGSEPYSFSGPVFFTGPYGGDPFGLSIPVAAVAGPFNFGTVVTRAGIGIEPYSGRVVVSSPLPTIVKGVPLRLRSVSVTVDHPNFLLNPTNCGVLATDSTLTSSFGATQQASSPFSVGNCGALGFSPSLTVSSNAKTSKADGASLQVSITQGAHQANIWSIVTQLPTILSVRDTTLHLACTEATAAADLLSCPHASQVGSASASTPVLPDPLHGHVFLVSHGGAAFPDLDVVLEGDGVRVILVGKTKITLHGIISTTFASLPDVPIRSFSLSLPTGSNSVLAAIGNLCAKPLLMPTTITAQSGKQIARNSAISVAGCTHGTRARARHRRLFRIISARFAGQHLLLKVHTSLAGRLLAGGRYLTSASRRLPRAMTVTLRLALTPAGASATRHHKPMKLSALLTFKPSKRGLHATSMSVRAVLRR